MRAQPRGTDGSLLLSLPWTIGALLASLAPHCPTLVSDPGVRPWCPPPTVGVLAHLGPLGLLGHL